jgi:PIN domain nuclease of toxin-antitoxin system
MAAARDQTVDATVLAITPDIAATAAALPIHGDPADRLIVATAIVHRAPLVTKDQRIRAAGVVETLW